LKIWLDFINTTIGSVMTRYFTSGIICLRLTQLG
jgi:hypothetical protein